MAGAGAGIMDKAGAEKEPDSGGEKNKLSRLRNTALRGGGGGTSGQQVSQETGKLFLLLPRKIVRRKERR